MKLAGIKKLASTGEELEVISTNEVSALFSCTISLQGEKADLEQREHLSVIRNLMEGHDCKTFIAITREIRTVFRLAWQLGLIQSLKIAGCLS